MCTTRNVAAVRFALGSASFFCGERFERLDVQRLVHHHLFQPPIFLFQLARFLHVADLQSGVFRPPLIECGIRDAVFPVEVLNSHAGLGILQHR